MHLPLQPHSLTKKHDNLPALQNNLSGGGEQSGGGAGNGMEASNQRISFHHVKRNEEQELLLEHLTLTYANPEPSGAEQGRQRWVGRAPRASTSPTRREAASNHRIQEMMTHSHQILDITGLRNEASRNSSSLGSQDICCPGSPLGPRLAPVVSNAASSVAVGHSSCWPQCLVLSTVPLGWSLFSRGFKPGSTGDPTPPYAFSKHMAPPPSQLLF